MVKQKIGILLSFSALLILMGVGCATTKSPAVEDSAKPESTENQSVNNAKTGDENGLESEDESESDVEDNGANATVKPGSQTPAPTDGAKAMLTMAEVAKHNTSEDCYIVVRGNVYDVTKFTFQHPGGSEAIIPLCGKDATTPFTQQHGGQKKPESVLAGLEIGPLQK